MDTSPIAPEIYIRSMQYDDLERVAAIDRASYTMPWPDHSFHKEMEKPFSVRRVVEICLADGSRQVIGMIITWIVMDEGHIATIAIDPAYRKLGLARWLLLDTLKICVQQKVRTVTLEVRESNRAARKLYRGFEFEEVARRRGYYTDDFEDALIMNAYRLDEAYLVRMTDYVIEMNQDQMKVHSDQSLL